jgi:hypothetical protein
MEIITANVEKRKGKQNINMRKHLEYSLFAVKWDCGKKNLQNRYSVTWEKCFSNAGMIGYLESLLRFRVCGFRLTWDM